MELSLRLDTLGMVEMRYLRNRERYRDWPSFQLLAASRQARVTAYMTKDIAEQLHQQILIVEAAVGLDEDDDDDDESDDDSNGDEGDGGNDDGKADREGGSFSPAFAQALERLNDLARQRLPESGTGTAGSDVSLPTGELSAEGETVSDEEDALEQLQDAFVQMMEVVRELAEELSTDALKLSGRFRCARTNIEFIQALSDDDDDEDEEEHEHEHVLAPESEENVLELEVELVMVLQLFEEGRARPDDMPAVELQLDVDDFERLHETLDISLEHERRSRRRK